MDKQHLIDLISNSLICESQNFKSKESSGEIINYLNKLNLDQLRIMSKEFILQILKYRGSYDADIKETISIFNWVPIPLEKTLIDMGNSLKQISIK